MLPIKLQTGLGTPLTLRYSQDSSQSPKLLSDLLGPWKRLDSLGITGSRFSSSTRVRVDSETNAFWHKASEYSDGSGTSPPENSS